MAKTERRIWLAVVSLALLTVYSLLWLYQLDDRFQGSEHLSAGLSARVTESIQMIEAERDRTLKSLHDSVASELVSVARTVSDEQAQEFENRLRDLVADVSRRETEVAALKEERNRLINELPEQIDLDQVHDYYAGKCNDESMSFGPVETFNTALGPITFYRSHFTLACVPSSNRPAWVKIGKDNSAENSELIKAWIDESERAKTRLGYKREYRHTNPADYGEYTESLYRKGDMYFKTFLQYQRVQGTYDRHSLQYTYYVEIGSTARKQEYELEQYNNKLGS